MAIESLGVLRLLLAGFLAAVAMSLAGLIPHLAKRPAVDMGQIVATKLLGVHVGQDSRLALIAHLAFGTVLGLVYGLAFAPFVVGLLYGLGMASLAPWLRGGLFGALVWLVVMVVVLPAVGDGAFGRRIGAWLGPVTLAMHLVFGVVLGVLSQ